MGLSTDQILNLEKEKTMPEIKERVDPITGLPTSFPSNSHKQNAYIPVLPKKVDLVVKGKVSKAKKPRGKKISETFLGDNLKNAFRYVVEKVLIPTAKSTVSDLAGMGGDVFRMTIDRMIFGENVDNILRGRRSVGSTGPRINYTGYSSRSRRPNDNRYFAENDNYPRGNQPVTTLKRVRQNFDDIVMESRQDAEEVLTRLLDFIDNYGIVSIAEFYDMIGQETSYADFKYGWEELGQAVITRVRDGYVLHLPKPIQL